jgi:uncharacterized membrane protein YraQ (UPF0718 family)
MVVGMNKAEMGEALAKTVRNFRSIMPMLIGMVLLVSLAITAIPESYYSSIFTGNPLVDPVLGSVAGSIAAGNPVTSYIIGGELLRNGVSLIAVAAFIIAWVTVGIVQLPAEGMMLGKRFTLARNLAGFVSAIAISIIMIAVMGAV